jgi:hypothetical protein
MYPAQLNQRQKVFILLETEVLLKLLGVEAVTIRLL